MRILHFHTGQKVTWAATVFRMKYPHANLRRSCVHFSRDVQRIFGLGGEPSQKLVKCKQWLDNWLPSLWASRSIPRLFLSWLTADCNYLEWQTSAWHLSSPEFPRRNLSAMATNSLWQCSCRKYRPSSCCNLYMRQTNYMCTWALWSSSSFSLCVMRLQLASDFDLQVAHGCASISKNGFSAIIFLNAWFLISTFVISHCTPCSNTVVMSILSSNAQVFISSNFVFQMLVVRFRLVVFPFANDHSSIRRLLLRLWEWRCTFICIHPLVILYIFCLNIGNSFPGRSTFNVHGWVSASTGEWSTTCGGDILSHCHILVTHSP